MDRAQGWFVTDRARLWAVWCLWRSGEQHPIIVIPEFSRSGNIRDLEERRAQVLAGSRIKAGAFSGMTKKRNASRL